MTEQNTKERGKRSRRRKQKPAQNKRNTSNTKAVAETVNTWRIKSEPDGGMCHFIDGEFYGFGATLPKLRTDLFKKMRSSGQIEVIETREIEQ